MEDDDVKGAYYNENDPYPAQWLRNLISAGHIAPGDVDERSIVDVSADDLHGYAQCHFFAGIGVWSHSLRLAGWGDNEPVWTGSCPCQPFSAAGKGGGLDDERHLWPAFYHLIEKCRPSVVFGEQVASKDGLAWLDLVQADMEATDYAFAALDLCAAGFGAPHIRQRLYWLANTASDGRRQIGADVGGSAERSRPQGWTAGLTSSSGIGELGHSQRAGLEGHRRHGDNAAGRTVADRSVAETSAVGELADSDGGDASTEGLQRSGQQRLHAQEGSDVRAGHQGAWTGVAGELERPGPTNGFWRDVDWLLCRDGKWRPVEPGTFPLANGVTSRVGKLRAYGNAIVATQAAEFIAAYIDIVKSPE